MINTILGTAASEDILGTTGDDQFYGGGGADTMTGGAGNDTYVIDVAAPDTVVEDTLAASGTDRVEVNGTFSIAEPVDPPIGNAAPGQFSGIEEIYYAGTSGVTLTGNALKNTLQSGSGNDCLIGGAGADTMIGGDGNDTYVIDGQYDKITEVVDNPLTVAVWEGGIDQVNSAEDIILDPASGVENILLTGDFNISASGTNIANTITGNDKDNVLRGLDGNDTLDGKAGDDLLDGGRGADCLVGGSGNDTFMLDATVYSDGSIRTSDIVIDASGTLDEIRVAASVDLTTLAEIEKVWLLDPTAENTTNTFGLLNKGDFDATGNASANVLKGNAGNNILDGKAGADTMSGGTGYDIYVVDDAGDVVTENRGEGSDKVISYLDSYTLPSNVENLDVSGGAGSTGIGNISSNIITGNGADNVLSGLGGKDTLDGGLGNDCLDGGIETQNEIPTADIMLGGGGDDTYVVDTSNDSVVDEGYATDRDQVVLIPTFNSYLTSSIGVGGTVRPLQETRSALNPSGVTNNWEVGVFYADGTSEFYGRGVQLKMYFDTLSTGDLNYQVPAVGENEAIAGQVFINPNYFYALGSDVEDLTVNKRIFDYETDFGKPAVVAVGPNYIYGNTGNNYIISTTETTPSSTKILGDYIDGQVGDDTMAGGLGDDTYVVDSRVDKVVEDSGEGTDLVLATSSFDLSSVDLVDGDTDVHTATVENLTLLESRETIVDGRPVLSALGTLNFNGLGNDAANVITGNSGNNTLTGAGGNDTISGAEGNDNIDGGTGNDSLTSGAGTDSLAGAEGNDTLKSGAGDDTLTGGAGNDYLDGGTGVDAMAGGIGNDTYFVDSLTDTISEFFDEGTDLVNSSVSFSLTSHSEVENLTLTDTSDINGTGNNRGNVITGNAGKNLLDGGAGIDRMIGGAGDDTFVVSELGDVVSENYNEGTDEVQSSDSYSLAASPNIEKLTLAMGAGNIDGVGSALDNVITGNEGNNSLDGGGSVLGDTLFGGLGDDTYLISDNTDVVVENIDLLQLSRGTADLVLSSAPRFTLPDNVENLTLTGTGDIGGTGNNYDNLITGNEGNNILDGGAGDDTLVGALGNDTYIVASEFVTIIELAGPVTGTDEVQTSSSYTLSDNIENLRLNGADADNLNGWGNSLPNQLVGDGGANHLFGYAGNDSLDGGSGNDTMVGGAGNDTYVVAEALDVISENLNQGTDLVQTVLAYTLGNNLENLTLTGDGNINGTGNALNNFITGNDGGNVLDAGIDTALGLNTLVGGLGNDTLTSGLSDDNLDGGTGNDNLSAGDGANSLLGGSGDDTLLAGAGNDTLDGGEGSDSITSGDGNNALKGGLGNDTLLAGSGTDNLDGGAGDDNLDGGAGADAMDGGTGNDIYYVDDLGDAVSETASGVSGGTDIVNSSVTFTLGANIEKLMLTGGGNIDGTGNILGNVIDGNTGNNLLDGGKGRDKLDGKFGKDTLLGGELQDSLTGDGDSDVLDGGSGDDFLIGTSSALAGAGEFDTLTGGIGGDISILGDAAACYYDTAAAAGDYALITDFTVTDNDQLQLKTLAAAPGNVNGYVIGGDINALGLGASANSYLYRDANSNSTADLGDSLIAAIQATGGTGAGGALTTADLNTVGYFV